jgi:hypothetical protein
MGCHVKHGMKAFKERVPVTVALEDKRDVLVFDGDVRCAKRLHEPLEDD